MCRYVVRTHNAIQPAPGHSCLFTCFPQKPFYDFLPFTVPSNGEVTVLYLGMVGSSNSEKMGDHWVAKKAGSHADMGR